MNPPEFYLGAHRLNWCWEGAAAGAASDVEDIDAGTFEHTGIATVMLTMRKPS